jgi:hypothetical protein
MKRAKAARVADVIQGQLYEGSFAPGTIRSGGTSMKTVSTSIVVLMLAVLSLSATPTPAMASDPISRAVPRLASASAVQVAEVAGQVDADTTSEGFSPVVTITMPIIVNNYRGDAECSLESPFSLEIAAIHQIKPFGDQAVAAEAEAEWLARYEAGFPNLVDALKDSGACWTRIEISWRKIQPDSPDTYDWSFFDEKLGLLAAADVQMVAIIDKLPDWAGPDRRGPIDADYLDEFEQFLSEVVDRYGEEPYGIRHWEMFNEADWVDDVDPPNVGWGFNALKYIDMLEVADDVIKGADPGATILMGGLAYDAFEEYRHPPFNQNPETHAFHRYFPDEVLDWGGEPYLDVLNFHYFPDFSGEWERWNTPPPPSCGTVYDGVGDSYNGSGIDLIAKTNHFRNRLKKCFGVSKPIWVTELGEHGKENNPESLAEQSRYVLKGYARGLAAGVKNITWFTLVSPPYDPYDQGLLTTDDWSPKPAFHTYQTLTFELAGYEYDHTIVSDGVEGYEFRRPLKARKAIVWSKNEGDTALLTFSPADRVLRVSRLGKEKVILDGGSGDEDGLVNGEVKLRLTNNPVIVVY